MWNDTNGIVRAVFSALFFPMFFQETVMRFAWGAGDEMWLLIAKRLFLLLPAAAIVLACWATVFSVLSIPIRSNRHEFITALFVTWWDLGKSILNFWGGIARFVLSFLSSVVALARLVVLAAWSIVYDVALMPLRFLRHLGQSVVKSPIPWIAVSLTLTWCIVETTIFTYVMSPVVIDTFSNITGETLSEAFVRVPLFLFLFFVVMGSYAVLSTFVDALRSKSVNAIAGIAVIECVVLFVEVVFLYREFVDSLVPWFAQYSARFELGIFWTLAIACFAWFGIRSLSWFLFAAHGTPTIMAVIQGRGLDLGDPVEAPRLRLLEISESYWETTRREAAWMKTRGEELAAALLLPPLEVIAAGINFCTLCVINTHLFALPFKSLEAIRYSEKLIKDFRKRSGIQSTEGSPRKSRRPSKPRHKAPEPEPAIERVSAVTDAFDDIPTR